MVTRTISCVFLSICFLFVSVVCPVSLAQDSRGFKYNNLTVSPYVNLDYSYDSNVDYDSGSENSDEVLSITPGVDLTYRGNEWGLSGSAWYSHDHYMTYDELNADRYGETLSFYRESAKGWRLLVGQTYLNSSQNDSIIDGGRGLYRDREQFTLTGALSYELGERMGVTLSGMYSDLDYINDDNKYGTLYGNQQWTAGLQLSRKLTEKSNVLLSGSYNEQTSDGTRMVGTRSVGDTSTGYSVMAGVSSRATKRITYSMMTGLEWFNYGDEDLLMGWAYSLNANWTITKKLAASVSGSSHYQPSESTANQAMRVYMLSTGLTYRPMRKLMTRLDVAYRREENEYEVGVAGASTDDVFSVRTRADYELMRYVSMYGGLEYETRFSDYEDDEFDRYRATLGLQFRY